MKNKIPIPGFIDEPALQKQAWKWDVAKRREMAAIFTRWSNALLRSIGELEATDCWEEIRVKCNGRYNHD